jgi:hypothetical protein
MTSTLIHELTTAQCEGLLARTTMGHSGDISWKKRASAA